MEIVENYRHFCGYPGKRKRNRAGGYHWASDARFCKHEGLSNSYLKYW